MRKALAGAQLSINRKAGLITVVCFDESGKDYAELVIAPAIARELMRALEQAVMQINPLLLVDANGKAL